METTQLQNEVTRKSPWEAHTEYNCLKLPSPGSFHHKQKNAIEKATV